TTTTPDEDDEGGDVTEVELVIAKGRDGVTRGKIPMEFAFRKYEFTELDLATAQLGEAVIDE
ncbi:MAG: hypothetical protein ACYSVY_27935, partial [Planctomycetota bacterium]